MGLESKNAPEQTSDLLMQLKQSILSSQEILRQDTPFVIPSKLQLSLGQPEKLCYESPARAHKIVKKDATTYEYTMKGVIPVGQHNEFVEACMANVNALLSDPNYVIDVSINEPNPEKNDPGGLGVGIGGTIARTEHKGEYIGRLTVTLVVGTKTSGKQRVTSVDAQGVYFVSDPINNPNADVSAQYEKQKSTLTGYTQVKPKNVSVGDQNALFALQYKLNKAAAAATPNQPVVTNKPPEAYEALESKVSIGSKIDRLSTEGAVCVPIFFDGKQVGSIVKCEAQSGRKPQAAFISAANTPQCFIKAGDSYFPDPAEINKYLQQTAPAGKQRKLTMITTGPCFASYTTPTVMSGVAYDDGAFVGNETSFADSISAGRGVATIKDGKLTVTHTKEFADPTTTLKTYQTEKRDVVTMSSVARVVGTERKINSDASLWRHKNAHSLVSFSDGKRGEVVVNDCDADTRKAVISSLMKKSGPYQIQRALYADSDASNDYLDGIWIADKNTSGLRYSHPSGGDLFRNPALKTSVPEVKNNMPGVMVYYAEKI